MKPARVPAVIPGSFASTEAIAHIMVQKFVMHSSLYRQAQELQRGGVQPDSDGDGNRTGAVSVSDV